MSEPLLISPLLDGYLMGEAISDHNGIRCCPAMDNQSGEKFIVKIISLPPSPTQLDAMLLAGVFSDQQSAIKYYEDRANDYIREIEILQQLSRHEGFLPCSGYQSVPSQEHVGFDVYILSKYMRTLERQFAKKPITHLEALNMSLDICAALTACRRSGYIYANLKPTNIYVTDSGEYKISDLGFIGLDGLKYAAMPENCINEYTAPEIEDAYSSVNDTLDVYSLGMILYRIFNGGTMPDNKKATLTPPIYADDELSAIILKACSISPEDRWRDPVQMGQMLVSYIQKNGAHDTPIVPPAPEPEIITAEPDVTDETSPEDSPETIDTIIEESTPEDILPEAENEEEPLSEICTDDFQSTETEDMPVTGEENSSENSDLSSETFSEVCITDLEQEDTSEPEEDDSFIVSAEPSSEPVIAFENDCINSGIETITENETPDIAISESPETTEDNTENLTDLSLDSESTIQDITPEMTEIEIMQIVQQHDAFAEEVAEIKAAAAYLELDRIQEDAIDSDYDGITEEVNMILSQADTLVAGDVPAPAVAPDASEIKLEIEEETEITDEISEDPLNQETEITEEEIDMSSNNKPRRSHLVRNIIIIILLLLLLAGGALFYQFIVIQTVDEFEVTGVKDQLIIEVSSEADEYLLGVSCIDEQGNKINQNGQTSDNPDGLIPIYQGKAQITGLRANTTYTLELQIAGLHILNGKTEKTYKTPDETTLLQHNVITGNEPGSAILNFTIGGPDSQRWNFTYSTPGYPEKTTSFQGTNVTLTDLLPNKTYTGVLTPEDDLFITKPLEIEFTASELIQARDLMITSCSGNKLTVQWKAPENTVVESWTVRCYSNKEGSNDDQTVTTSATSHEFKVKSSLDSFTVEVTAIGQATHQEVTIPANSVTVTDLNADTSISGAVNLSWESQSAPKNGWTISYKIKDSDAVTTINSKEKNIVIKPVVPNMEYTFTVASADAVHTFCQEVSAITKATEDFTIDINNKKITVADLTVSIFKQPSAAQWDHTTLKSTDYTSKFSVGDKAGLLVYLNKEYEESAAELNAAFVIYDDTGKIILVSSQDNTWKNAWVQNNYILNIPTLPDQAGYYKIALYFNGQFVSEHDLSIQ